MIQAFFIFIFFTVSLHHASDVLEMYFSVLGLFFQNKYRKKTSNVKHFVGFCAECKGSLLSDKILS